MDSPSRKRYENVFGDPIEINDVVNLNYHIMTYSEGKSMCKIKWPARVMIEINYNYYITICITKHFVFPLFPWNWFFNIRKELNFIKNHKDMFFKYWNNISDEYGSYISSIFRYMYNDNMTEEEAIYAYKHRWDKYENMFND